MHFVIEEDPQPTLLPRGSISTTSLRAPLKVPLRAPLRVL